jgi:translation initiation factor IF-3
VRGRTPAGVGPFHNTKEHHISEPRINERIRVPEVRLVGPNGEQVGIVRVEDALRLAAEADLDLVEVAPMARPPVAKLMDFGKFKYEAAMKAREARKNQVNTVIKEIKLRPKIDPHDYGTKKGHVERFLKAGDKVKVTIMFRGREQSRPELGYRLLQRLAEDVGDLAFVESSPKQDGRNMIMVLGPTKKKAEAKAEQRRRRDDAKSDADTSDVPDLSDLTHLAGSPETTAPETTVAEVTVPEATEPATVPEATVPEATVPEATVAEVTEPEVTVPEATVPEATVPEAPEAIEPEAATPPQAADLPAPPVKPVVPSKPSKPSKPSATKQVPAKPGRPRPPVSSTT